MLGRPPFGEAASDPDGEQGGQDGQTDYEPRQLQRPRRSQLSDDYNLGYRHEQHREPLRGVVSQESLHGTR